ncbi:hypothetical protein A9239_03585 [Methanosarcina sp. A14]|nr:hypothetical protein A9239_03585 [Methanosarcina sp. A14]
MGQGYGSRLWVKVMSQNNLSYGIPCFIRNQSFENILLSKRVQVQIIAKKPSGKIKKEFLCLKIASP